MVLKDKLGKELLKLSICSKQVINCQHCSSRVSTISEILCDTVAVQEEEEQQKMSAPPARNTQVKVIQYRDTSQISSCLFSSHSSFPDALTLQTAPLHSAALNNGSSCPASRSKLEVRPILVCCLLKNWAECCHLGTVSACSNCIMNAKVHALHASTDECCSWLSCTSNASTL